MSSLDNLRHRFLIYSETFRGSTPATIKWFKNNLKMYFTQAEITDHKEITRKCIEEWIMMGKLRFNWSPKTIRNRLQVISSFCSWLIREGFMTTNPVEGIPRPKLPKRLPKSLPRNTAINLIEWTEHYPYRYPYERTRAIALLTTFIYSGLRREEVRNLKVMHVDFDRGTIFVQSGKGNKDRIVPMNAKLREHLRAYQSDRMKAKKTCPYFFTSIHRDTQMGYEVIPKLFNKIRKSSKIDFYPHLLRHTFATLMLEGGCDIFSLSKMMGHSDLKTTAIYLSASDGHMRTQIERHPI